VRILIYSRAFWPSIGGIETVSLTLASWLAEKGHECVVLTETPAALENDRKFAFPVVRQPSTGKRWSLFRWSDIVHSNGASLHGFVWAKCAAKPIIWTHAGYHLICVDGLGWYAGAPAPMSPGASIFFHARKRGVLPAIGDAFKLYLRRWASRHVSLNVAITEWVATRQPLRRQIVIHNPFPLSFWRTANRSADCTYNLVFVGRLVSEKGVDTLLRAVSRIGQLRKSGATLCVIGDGPERGRLTRLATELGIAPYVTFAGALSGQQLLDTAARARIAVVPSVWEEPMGGVALEMMAAGQALVVSERGGLMECCGPAALAFPNGDASALAEALRALLDSPQRVERLQKEAPDRLALFDEGKLCERYEAAYAAVLGG
jgi:glycosyltransferase involved in cell wall biosynthesis